MKLFHKTRTRRKKKQAVEFIPDRQILQMIHTLIDDLHLDHIDKNRVYAIRSHHSVVRAYARIWGMSRVFSIAAGIPPTYVIEVVSEKFDPLPPERQMKVLIHELMHIPKTFSGALLSHRGRYHSICEDTVDELFAKLKEAYKS